MATPAFAAVYGAGAPVMIRAALEQLVTLELPPARPRSCRDLPLSTRYYPLSRSKSLLGRLVAFMIGTEQGGPVVKLVASSS
jgi:hypothetical protein